MFTQAGYTQHTDVYIVYNSSQPQGYGPRAAFRDRFVAETHCLQTLRQRLGLLNNATGITISNIGGSYTRYHGNHVFDGTSDVFLLEKKRIPMSLPAGIYELYCVCQETNYDHVFNDPDVGGTRLHVVHCVEVVDIRIDAGAADNSAFGNTLFSRPLLPKHVGRVSVEKVPLT